MLPDILYPPCMNLPFAVRWTMGGGVLNKGLLREVTCVTSVSKHANYFYYVAEDATANFHK